jgi:hypothetical protein
MANHLRQAPHMFVCVVATGLWLCASARPVPAADDPLPAWNEGPAKRAIVDFVNRVTMPGGKDFVPEPERIGSSTTTAPCGPSSRCTFSSRLRCIG